METRINVAACQARIQAAEAELRAAKEAHRQAFREALVELCNKYDFRIEADGYGLEINERGFGAALTLKDFPE